MIWHVQDCSGFQTLFLPAGEIDQGVIAAYLKRSGKTPPPQKHTEEHRHYYLHRYDKRILLVTVGLPIEHWQGQGWVKVGTGQILGEFEGQRLPALLGRKDLRLQLLPIDLAEDLVFDRHFKNAQEAMQALDLRVLNSNRRA